MGRRGLLLLALAGCDEGVFLEVRAPAGATEVELYVGTTPCRASDGTDCGHLTPATFDAPIAGAVFFRDRASRYTAAVDASGSAWFQLAPDPVAIPLLVAIASGAQSGVAVVHDLAIDRTQQIVIEQAPATPWSPDTREIATNSAWLWPNRECVGARGTGDVVFVVPADDPDCDRVIENECDPLAYSEDDVGGDEREPCTDWFEPAGERVKVCRTGTTAVDCGHPTSCELDGPIVAPRVCDCDGDLGCTLAELRRDETPHFRCTLVGEQEDTSGPWRTCPAEKAGSHPAPLELAQAEVCGRDGGLAALAVPLAATTFGPEVSLPPVVTLDRATGCDRLTWSAAAGPSLPPAPARILYFARATAAVPHGILVALDIEWSDDCSTVPHCELVGDPLSVPR